MSLCETYRSFSECLGEGDESATNEEDMKSLTYCKDFTPIINVGCEKCIHDKVCVKKLYGNGGCYSLKDKNKLIEVPINFDDEVWIIGYTDDGSFTITKDIVNEIHVTKATTFIKVKNSYAFWIVYEWGKNAFSNKEDAEKRLEELKK